MSKYSHCSRYFTALHGDQDHPVINSPHRTTSQGLFYLYQFSSQPLYHESGSDNLSSPSLTNLLRCPSMKYDIKYRTTLSQDDKYDRYGYLV